MDYTTLNTNRLKALPTVDYHVLVNPNATHYGNHVSAQMGSACFLDPPGYPTYFLQACYDRTGNTPDWMPGHVIRYMGVSYVVDRSANEAYKGGKTWDQAQAEYHKLLHSLWVSLPYEHERVQAWVEYVYAYFRNCYVDPETGNKNADSLVIAKEKPVFMKARGMKWEYAHRPYLLNYYGEHINDRPQDRAKYIELYKKWKADRKAAGKANAKLVQIVREVTSNPENYRAAQYVREFYPEHETRHDLIANPPAWGKGGAGDWWERMAEKPEPSECPLHPRNGDWCQFCGWVKPEAEPVTA